MLADARAKELAFLVNHKNCVTYNLLAIIVCYKVPRAFSSHIALAAQQSLLSMHIAQLTQSDKRFHTLSSLKFLKESVKMERFCSGNQTIIRFG